MLVVVAGFAELDVGIDESGGEILLLGGVCLADMLNLVGERARIEEEVADGCADAAPKPNGLDALDESSRWRVVEAGVTGSDERGLDARLLNMGRSVGRSRGDRAETHALPIPGEGPSPCGSVPE